ncbi:hypothetical protein [uncultured Cohaesibacter sp.]|uniref:hypothetical protein n=1 Tax=uncultured Cohaesibacter sp. TaxID=1002546 RepID=UPI0029C7D57A|nr:hypothetical protein [uncultured Cohaesibacter sp.]
MDRLVKKRRMNNDMARQKSGMGFSTGRVHKVHSKTGIFSLFNARGALWKFNCRFFWKYRQISATPFVADANSSQLDSQNSSKQKSGAPLLKAEWTRGKQPPRMRNAKGRQYESWRLCQDRACNRFEQI